jgi:predicted MFS family arabinose efflux permease
LAAALGTLSPTGTEVGPFLSIEQVIIPQTCPDKKRTDAFSFYSVSGYLAGSFGALLGGVPVLVQGFGLSSFDGYRLMFGTYAAFGLATFVIYTFLSEKVEYRGARPQVSGQRNESDARIAKLSLLFSLDAFAGGFILQSIVSYWFYVSYGIALGSISLVFFVTGMLTTASFLAAPRIASRIGLLRTAVITHLASNVFLILVPFSPSFSIALVLWFARSSLSQMDVPTRQSYIVAVVEPEKRTIATSTTNTSRNVAQSVTPLITGYVIGFALAAPFLLAGVLKSIYDAGLYLTFRKVKPPEENG